MAKRSTRQVHKIEYEVSTTKDDILSAGMQGCRRAEKCMEKIANARAIKDQLGVAPHLSKVRIDAGKILFNYDGWRWRAFTPKMAKKALIDYDKLTTALKRKRVTEDEFDEQVAKKILPHKYKVEADRQTKIQKFTREQKDRINENRKKRVPKPAKRYTVGSRVIGHR